MWKFKIEAKDGAGRRVIADVFAGDGYSEMQVHRQLADGEVWPPPKPETRQESAAILSAAERAALLSGIQAAITGPSSHLDERSRSEAARLIEWNREHRGR